MTSDAKRGAGHNWSGILIAVIGATSTLGATWLTLTYTPPAVTAAPPAEIRLASPAPAVSAMPSALPAVVPAASVAGELSETVVVPALADLTIGQAGEQLRALGLALDIRDTESAEPAGKILGVEPEPGSAVKRGTKIALQVSAGPAPAKGKGKKGR